ncbi:MAG: MFS transporter [Anaerolineae bacterium]|nr:MFS transporter [Anaerolineae bacterium]
MSSDAAISPREVRRSFALNVFNGAAFELAEKLIDPPLVLTWFVSQLTGSNLLIGLVATLADAGWFLPQMFVSAPIQRMERKMPAYTLAAVIRTLAWIALAVGVWLVDDPTTLLVAFFVLYTTARMSGGLAGLSFFDVTAKTIPVQRRGSLFALRQFLGGVAGLSAGWVIRVVLGHPQLPFPHGHAVLFGLYCAIMIPALGAFIAIREPAGPARRERATLGTQFRRAGALLRADRVYRRYMASRLVLGLTGIALPFYAIYAKNALGAPEWMVGVYVFTRVAAQLLANLPWGWLSDRYGNRRVMKYVHIGNSVTLLIALGLIALVSGLQVEGSWLPYLALPLFLLNGAVTPAQVLVGSNFLLELVPENDRPLYLGLSNTLMGSVVLVSALSGLLVDLFDFAGLFVVGLVLSVVGYALTRGLPEPREASS